MNNFVEEIEEIKNNNNIDYIDAVVTWCQKNNLEVETAAYWIKRDSVLKAKIQLEAENLRIIKKTSERLPL
jgi:hypothetical protein